ncbi:atherin-like [Candoia aspera]|uniref:atherin-like n=1 Tax=Candoia aspera TaxID=51853 RepID=UPI002FD81444
MRAPEEPPPEPEPERDAAAAAFERHWRREFPGEALPALRLGSAAALEEELGRCREALRGLQRALAQETLKARYLEAALAGRARGSPSPGAGAPRARAAPLPPPRSWRGPPPPPPPPPRARRSSSAGSSDGSEREDASSAGGSRAAPRPASRASPLAAGPPR